MFSQLDFLHMGFVDVLDILLVAMLIFYVVRLLKGSQAMRIFISIMALYAFRVLAAMLNMKLTASLLGAILDVGLIALIVIFQPEIRRFLSTLGSSYSSRALNSAFIGKFFHKEVQDSSDETIIAICNACRTMSDEKCGALIVLQRRNPLKYYVESGDSIDAKVSERLILNLFFKNSPMHDGAVVISGDRVVAARCTLPITENKVPASFGMRHKAAVGLSEVVDAVVIVVSEETGNVSVVRDGKATRIKTFNDLKQTLQNA